MVGPLAVVVSVVAAPVVVVDSVVAEAVSRLPFQDSLRRNNFAMPLVGIVAVFPVMRLIRTG